MEYIWIIALIYIIFKAFTSAGRRDFPGRRLPEPGSYGERHPAPVTRGDYSGLPDPGQEPADLKDDRPLSGPWSKPRGASPFPPAPVEDDYLAGPWGRGPLPRQEDTYTGDKTPDAARMPEEVVNKQPEKVPEVAVERETPGERVKPRKISGLPSGDSGRDRAGQRAAARKEYEVCKIREQRMDETDGQDQPVSAYCYGNLRDLLTAGNIRSGIILAEVLGPRGGRGRRRR